MISTSLPAGAARRGAAGGNWPNCVPELRAEWPRQSCHVGGRNRHPGTWRNPTGRRTPSSPSRIDRLRRRSGRLGEPPANACARGGLVCAAGPGGLHQRRQSSLLNVAQANARGRGRVSWPRTSSSPPSIPTRRLDSHSQGRAPATLLLTHGGVHPRAPHRLLEIPLHLARKPGGDGLADPWWKSLDLRWSEQLSHVPANSAIRLARPPQVIGNQDRSLPAIELNAPSDQPNVPFVFRTPELGLPACGSGCCSLSQKDDLIAPDSKPEIKDGDGGEFR